MAKQMRKAAVCCRSEFACCAQVSVLEMDGQFDKIEELIYVESHLSNTSAKFYGEITQQMLKNSQFPGSNNGTGLFQTIVGLKIREVGSPVISSCHADFITSVLYGLTTCLVIHVQQAFLPFLDADLLAC